jgi:hypothetical protein
MQTIDRIGVTSTPSLVTDSAVIAGHRQEYASSPAVGVAEDQPARETRRRYIEGWLIYAGIVLAAAVAAGIGSPR